MAANAIVGQSGGPTAVINQSLVGVVEALKAGGKDVGTIYGAMYGVRGMVEGKLIEMNGLDAAKLERIARTPSSALGSSRDKPDAEYCKRIVKALAERDIRYFFYIGGNDSSDTTRIVSEMAQSQGYDLRAFHVPKTIDNDLMENDHTPGFGSAAKFVACAFIGDNLDNRSLPGIKINVVMGRHAGFLTAASALARQFPDDGPHLVYVPEKAFDIDKFIGDVDAVYKRLGRCIIAVSEGVHDAAGAPIITKLAKNLDKDDHGNVQLAGTGALGDHLAAALKAKLGAKLRVRADTLGYMQRSFPGVVSEVDAREARESARKAVELALKGEKNGSIAIKRLSNEPYKVAYERIELSAVAAKTRHMPPEMLAGDNDVTAACLAYLKPIVGELPVTEQLPLVK